MSFIFKLLGERIKQMRTERGLSAKEVTAPLGLDRTFLSHIECGRHPPSLRTLSQLAEFFNVDELDLLTFPSANVRHALIDMTRGAHLHTLLAMRDACQKILNEQLARTRPEPAAHDLKRSG